MDRAPGMPVAWESAVQFGEAISIRQQDCLPERLGRVVGIPDKGRVEPTRGVHSPSRPSLDWRLQEADFWPSLPVGIATRSEQMNQ